MKYLCWYDDSKKSTAAKIADGIEAYQARFGNNPTVVLVNSTEVVEVAGVLVQAETYIRRNNYWIGLAP